MQNQQKYEYEIVLFVKIGFFGGQKSKKSLTIPKGGDIIIPYNGFVNTKPKNIFLERKNPMKKKLLALLLAVVQVVVCFSVFATSTMAADSGVNVPAVTTAPTVDGTVTAEEYAGAIVETWTKGKMTANVYKVTDGSYTYYGAIVTQEGGFVDKGLTELTNIGTTGSYSSAFVIDFIGGTSPYIYFTPSSITFKGYEEEGYGFNSTMKYDYDAARTVDGNTMYCEFKVERNDAIKKYRYYLADCAGGNGWINDENSITLVWGEVCTHTKINPVAAVPSTCTVKGTIAHYACAGCDATYSDAAGATPISDVSAPLADHTDTDGDGLCDTCGTIIAATVPFSTTVKCDGEITDGEYDDALTGTLTDGAATAKFYMLNDGANVYIAAVVTQEGGLVSYTKDDEWLNIALYSTSFGLIANNDAYQIYSSLSAENGYVTKSVDWVATAMTTQIDDNSFVTEICLPVVDATKCRFVISDANAKTTNSISTVSNGSNCATEVITCTFLCDHDVTAVAAKPSTCAEEGNIAHYRCDYCGRYFEDDDATVELSSVASELDPTNHVGDTDGDDICDGCDASLVVTPEVPADSYTGAAISGTATNVTVGDKVSFNVTVNEAYASAGLTLTYDPATLTLAGVTSSAAGATVSEPVIDNGTVTVTVFGDDAADAVITVTFTAIAAGDATVTLDSAAFSTQANADQDLTPATITTPTATVTVEEAIVKFDLYGANMKLGNELSMNFFFLQNAVTDWTGAYVVIEKEYSDKDSVTVKIPFTDWAENGESYYKVTFNGIAAKEMADNVYVTVYDAEGNAISNTWTDSVRAYAMRMLNKSTTQAKDKVFYVDMLNYGAAAQTKFIYNTEDLANSLLTDEQKALATEEATCEDGSVKGTNYYGTSLLLESSVSMKLYFTNVTEDMTAVVTFTDHLGNYKEVSYAVTMQESWGTVVVDAIVLADVYQLVTCNVYDAEGNVVATVVDSMGSYLVRQTKSPEFYDAVLKFAVSAYNYFHS